MRTAGIEVRPFRTTKGKWNRFQLNFRNHRKIVVVDGRLGFIGGLNVGDEYLGKGPLGPWRDTHLRLEGPSVLSIQLCYAPHSVANGARLNLWRDAILDRLAQALPTLNSKLLHVELELPRDLEQRFGCSGGHVQHGEVGLDQLLVRPAPQCARYATPIRGLYLGGRGSHPGPFGEGVAGFLAAERAVRESRQQRR